MRLSSIHYARCSAWPLERETSNPNRTGIQARLPNRQSVLEHVLPRQKQAKGNSQPRARNSWVVPPGRTADWGVGKPQPRGAKSRGCWHRSGCTSACPRYGMARPHVSPCPLLAHKGAAPCTFTLEKLICSDMGVGQNATTRRTAGFRLWFHLPIGQPIFGTHV